MAEISKEHREAAQTVDLVNACLCGMESERSICSRHEDIAQLLANLEARVRAESQDELERANAKWQLYEREYVLPCFEWAKEEGIDLHVLVREAKGNCVARLVGELRARLARVRAEERKRMVEIALAARKQRHEYAHQTAIREGSHSSVCRKFQQQWVGANYVVKELEAAVQEQGDTGK